MTEKEFISKSVSELREQKLKEFPGDIIEFEDGIVLTMPGKTLVIGEEFFGAVEVITTNGEQFLQAADHYEAKFIVYANRSNPVSILIPTDKNILKNAVTKYELYLDSVIKNIEQTYKKEFPEGKNASGVVNEIFRILNLVRY